MEKKHIGQAVKSRREQKGLSQGQLAYKSGIERATISLIESGDTDSPKLDTILHLALALDTTVDSLLIECGLLPPPDPDTVWQPEPLFMQRVLDFVEATLGEERRRDAGRVVMAQAHAWKQIAEMWEAEQPESSEDIQQDEEENNTL